MKKNKDGSGGPPPATISDPRFARVHTDPRFMRMPKNKTKVSIDKRFSHMFSDKSFSDPLGADKRGRAKKKKEKHILQRYYKVGEDEDEAEEKAEINGSSDEETENKTKSKGKDGNKTLGKISQEKKVGEKVKRKQTGAPKFPGPLAPSKLSLEGSDEEDNSDESSEDSDASPTVNRKGSDKEAVKIVDGKTSVKSKPSTPIVEESDEEGSDEEESDEGEDSASEIDLDSDEDEDLEINVGKKSRTAKASTAEQDSASEEGEDEDDDSASDAESSSSSSSSESEAEDEMDDPREAEKVPTAPGAETRRIAMMNMDWDHIKAVDLLMLMRSFQPKGGHVECVTIYPSEFGIEQMKAEEMHGPNMIFEDDEDDEDEDKEVNMEKLRAYERNKLKYYYAVVECDTKETANHLYTQCDGMEFERTSNTLDLRFIPDDMEFVREPRDVAKEVPQEGYKAPEFETRALQHSTVKLTWDDDEPTRVKALRKKFNADELNEMDFRDYLASASSEEELDEEEIQSSPERGTAPTDANSEAKSKKDKYRSLLLGGSTEEVEAHGQKKKNGDVDMEVTFHTGLSELSEKLMQKKEAKKRGDETVWEAYLRKKKEKKSQKKRSKNAKNSDDDYSSDEDVASPRSAQGAADAVFSHDDNGFDDPFFAEADGFPDESKAAPKKSSKAKQSADSDRLKKREEKEQKKKEEERTKAELELLLMDDDGIQGAARGFNLKSKKKGKGKSKKGGKDDDDQEDDKLASADLTDPRFAPLFSNHHYAIDPTNPQFRKSAAQLKILAEAQRRRTQKSEDVGISKAESTRSGDLNPKTDDVAQGSQDRKRKAELSSLVRSLKRKAGKPGK